MVVETWYRSSRLAHPFLSDAFMEEERHNLRHKYLPNTETWVTEIDDKIVGFIALIGDEVGGFFVDPDYQGRKIGLALMDKAVDLHGALHLEVFKENQLGRRFYDRYGFIETKESIFERTGDVVLHLAYSKK